MPMSATTAPRGADEEDTGHGGIWHPWPGYFGALGDSMEGESGEAGPRDSETAFLHYGTWRSLPTMRGAGIQGVWKNNFSKLEAGC